MKIVLILLTMVTTAFLVSGCGRNVSPNTYEAAEAGVASKVIQGVVIGKRKVKIDASSGGIGGLAGAAAGATGGSAIGNNDRSHIAGAIGGAVVGGVIGSQIDKTINQRQGYEYILKLKSDSIIAITQAQDLEFEIGQPVLVIYGATTRIVPDNCIQPSNPNISKSKIIRQHGRKKINRQTNKSPRENNVI